MLFECFICGSAIVSHRHSYAIAKDPPWSFELNACCILGIVT